MAKKLGIILLVILIPFTSLLAAEQAAGTAQAWQSYVKNPETHPNIPDNSYAGYRYGEQAIPDLPVAVNVKDFGAVGDGMTDSTGAINRAIQAATEKGGGAVLIPAGKYLISGIIAVRYDRIVLRGEGTGKTILFAAKSMEDIMGRDYGSTNASTWGWYGGVIWFSPAGKKLGKENWSNTLPLTPITSANRRGDTVITVADAARLKKGQRVLLSVKDPGDLGLMKYLVGNIPGADQYDWKGKAASRVNSALRWPVEIMAVEGNRVTLRQPLRWDIRPGWQGQLTTVGDIVRESGIEQMTIQLKYRSAQDHHLEYGYNAICFDAVWDCWARDLEIIDSDYGVGISTGKCVTVQDIRMAGKRTHHDFLCRVGSCDNLFTRFRLETLSIHGLNVESSFGNVWSEGVMLHGTFDYHRNMPFDNIKTMITITNDSDHGGSSGPVFGARNVHWNIKVTNGRAWLIGAENLMPYGAIVGVQGCGTKSYSREIPDFSGEMHALVESSGKTALPVLPANLHLAQLELRLGYLPEHFRQ